MEIVVAAVESGIRECCLNGHDGGRAGSRHKMGDLDVFRNGRLGNTAFKYVAKRREWSGSANEQTLRMDRRVVMRTVGSVAASEAIAWRLASIRRERGVYWVRKCEEGAECTHRRRRTHCGDLDRWRSDLR